MNEPSIIEIIQKMVQEGESEEAVLQTLNQLGVEQKKAQRLLLLAQADTFALLRSEIVKIVKQEVEKERDSLRSAVQGELRTASSTVKGQLFTDLQSDLRKYENEWNAKNTNYQNKLNETVQKFTELAERVRIRLNEMGKDVEQIKLDQAELRLKGISNKNRWISTLILIIGVIFVVADLGLFLFNFGGALTIDSIIIFIVMALIGVTMMFVATFV